MSTGHPLFGLTTEERERSLQLKTLLPTLEANLARHYKPYTFHNVVEDAQWTAHALQHVLFRLSACLAGVSGDGQPVHSAWPPFVRKLFWTEIHAWASPRDALPIKLRYPKLRDHNVWRDVEELQAMAIFFVRTYPSPSVYDLMQHLLVVGLSSGCRNSSNWTPFKHSDEANTTPYNPPFSTDETTQRLFDHLVTCHAKIFPQVPSALNVFFSSSPSARFGDDTHSASPTQAFEVVQNKGSGKTTALIDLAKKKMLGVVINLEGSYRRSTSDWDTFCLPRYCTSRSPSWDAEREFQCACFVASYMAAISIQLARLVRQRAHDIRGGGAPQPLTMQQWQMELVPFVARSTQSMEWHEQIQKQTRVLMRRGTPLTPDELASTEFLNSLPDARSTFKTFVTPKGPDEEDGPSVDFVALFANELKLYLYNESHVDNLASTLVEVLGLDKALGEPLFFCALDDHPELLQEARDVLVRMWQRIQHPSHWLILVGRGFRNDEHREFWSGSDEFRWEQKFSRPHPLVTLDTFVAMAVDLGWNGVPPSSSAFEVAQLRGVTFAGLECVSLRYGRPLWLADSMRADSITGQAKAHFGSIALDRVLTHVLGIEEKGLLCGNDRHLWLCLGLRLPITLIRDQARMQTGNLELSCCRIASFCYDTAALTRPTSPTSPTSPTTAGLVQVDLEPLQEPVCSATAAYIFRTKYLGWLEAVSSLELVVHGQPSNLDQHTVTLLLLLLHMANDLAHLRQSFGKDRECDKLYRSASTKTKPRIDGILEPVTLWDWLELLQNKDTRQTVREETLRWMRGQLVNFTHIAETATTWAANEAIPIGMLVDGWVRQCAWWLSPAHGHKDWLLLVPLHAANAAFVDFATGRPKQGTLSVHPFEPEALGFVLIRIASPQYGAKESDDNRDSQKLQQLSNPIRNSAFNEEVLTWSRVQFSENAARSGPRTKYCSHMVVTIDMQEEGPPDWLQRVEAVSGPPAGQGEEEQGRRSVQRHDLRLRGGGEGGLLACEALSFAAPLRWPSQEKRCSEG